VIRCLLCLLPSIAYSHDTTHSPDACGEAGVWLGTGSQGSGSIVTPAFIERLASRKVVLLGERHDSTEDHRWQLQTVAQLLARHTDLAIGFEMFPRRVQPILDRWVAGTLSEAEFLRQVEWERIWNFDPGVYLPLFHFARMNRIPMLALNVDRSLVEQIGRLGWEGVGTSQKEGVSRPAPPDPAYRTELHEIFEHHPARAAGEAAFPRFVEAQTVWDRAMAQAIAGYLQQHSGALVVSIMGAGHVRNGYGVPHQLKDLGVDQVAKLITWEMDSSCDAPSTGTADAVYLVKPPDENPPRLGVATEQDAAGVLVTEVQTGGIADLAGLRVGDLILEIAGRPARDPGDLRAAVQRMAPGTWLPLRVRRGYFVMDVIARFPAG